MDLKQFRYELERRGISENDVPSALLKEGKMKMSLEDGLPVYKKALEKVTLGGTVGALGGLMLADHLKMKRSVPLGLVGMGVGALGAGYLHNKDYVKNGRYRGMLRDEYLKSLSDLNPKGTRWMPESSEGKRWIPEEDEDQKTRTISRKQSLTSMRDAAIRLASTKTGKIIIGGAALATIAMIAKPIVVEQLKKMNTQSIDTSNYRYSDDASKVSQCSSRFNDFLTSNNPIGQANRFRYNDMEKLYLETLDAIERSSDQPMADKKYLTTMWEGIFALYQANDSLGKMDNAMRVNPSRRSIYSL